MSDLVCLHCPTCGRLYVYDSLKEQSAPSLWLKFQGQIIHGPTHAKPSQDWDDPYMHDWCYEDMVLVDMPEALAAYAIGGQWAVNALRASRG